MAKRLQVPRIRFCKLDKKCVDNTSEDVVWW